MTNFRQLDLTLRRLAATAMLAVSASLAGGAALAVDGGAMVVALTGDPPVINSGITTDISSSHIGGQIYSTIVSLDKQGNPIPSLAKSWEISEDGLTYTFHLFDNIKWHDGEPFTAEDIAWSLWNVNRELNGPASGLLGAVNSIEAVDDYTVVFHLDHAYPPLLRGLAYFNSSTILPEHIYNNGQDPRDNPANLKPVGTGPFKFVEYQKGSHVILEKNEDYHLEGLPHLDRLVFQIIPNPSARSIALQNGEIDFIPYYATPLGEVDALREAEGVTVAFQKRFIAGEYMVFMNTREGPLAEKMVRQALYYALDREAILEKAGFGFGTVSHGPISSEQTVFFSDDVPTYSYDPAKANAMLDEAGFPAGDEGIRFPLRVSYDLKDGAMGDTARLMRAYFADVGIDLKIEGMDSGAWRETAFGQWDFDLTMGSFSTGPDPAIGTERLYVCRNIQKLMARNASGYCNPELDEIFAAAASEVDEAKRAALYAQVQAILAEDVPHIWLWDRYYPIAYREGLSGMDIDVTGYGALDVVEWTE